MLQVAQTWLTKRCRRTLSHLDCMDRPGCRVLEAQDDGKHNDDDGIHGCVYGGDASQLPPQRALQRRRYNYTALNLEFDSRSCSALLYCGSSMTNQLRRISLLSGLGPVTASQTTASGRLNGFLQQHTRKLASSSLKQQRKSFPFFLRQCKGQTSAAVQVTPRALKVGH
jgi:hypothetical protein